jgi:hypothetical protein
MSLSWRSLISEKISLGAKLFQRREQGIEVGLGFVRRWRRRLGVKAGEQLVEVVLLGGRFGCGGLLRRGGVEAGQ